MSEPINDGGPAFPQAQCQRCGIDHQAHSELDSGMTLRDYFAAKAMTAIGRTYLTTTEHGESVDTLGKPTFAEEARRCYAWADAMLKAREAKS